MSCFTNLFKCRKRKILEDYLKDFQKQIDKGHQLACSNEITEKSFIDFRNDVCALLAGYKKAFGDENFAEFHLIQTIDTLSISENGVTAKNTSSEDREKQLLRFIINLESIVNAIVREFQLKESRIQSYISLFAVAVAIAVPVILNRCSTKINEHQFEQLVESSSKLNDNQFRELLQAINSDSIVIQNIILPPDTIKKK